MEQTEKTIDQEMGEVQLKQHFANGKVLKTTLQGALIDIGTKLPAFIHISQVIKADDPKAAINSVADVLKEGQEIEVWVKRIKKDRYELTMIKPLGLEWRELKAGMSVKGTVVRLETFGAFVEIGAERPGLVHISELSHGYVRTPSEVIKEGDEIEAQILDIDRRKKQIKLSMKALQEPPAAPEVEERPERPQRKNRNDKPRKEDYEKLEEPESETALAIALRHAMEKAGKEETAAKTARKDKKSGSDQDDIFARTLEKKGS